MSQHNEVGKIGEDLARKYLEEKGYKIIEQNYKTRFAEIDLVAEKQESFSWKNIIDGFKEKIDKKTGCEKIENKKENKSKLVFVEVRTKIGEQFGSPEETLDRKKLWKVLQNAKSYSAFKRWQGEEQIDAICIVLNPDFSVNRLTHHENIIS